MTWSRRRFLESGAALALGLRAEGWPGTLARGQAAGAPASPGEAARQIPADQRPEWVVVNARVYTVDEARPRAEAFAVRDGRFLAVGMTAEMRALAGPATRVTDAAGMTIVPGFIDAHCHPDGVRELTGVNVNLRTVAEVQAALRKKAAETPPGFWVSGYMYDDTKLDPGARKSRARRGGWASSTSRGP